eukprot:tig00021318_g20179.t1
MAGELRFVELRKPADAPAGSVALWLGADASSADAVIGVGRVSRNDIEAPSLGRMIRLELFGNSHPDGTRRRPPSLPSVEQVFKESAGESRGPVVDVLSDEVMLGTRPSGGPAAATNELLRQLNDALSRHEVRIQALRTGRSVTVSSGSHGARPADQRVPTPELPVPIREDSEEGVPQLESASSPEGDEAGAGAPHAEAAARAVGEALLSKSAQAKMMARRVAGLPAADLLLFPAVREASRAADAAQLRSLLEAHVAAGGRLVATLATAASSEPLFRVPPAAEAPRRGRGRPRKTRGRTGRAGRGGAPPAPAPTSPGPRPRTPRARARVRHLPAPRPGRAVAGAAPRAIPNAGIPGRGGRGGRAGAGPGPGPGRGGVGGGGGWAASGAEERRGKRARRARAESGSGSEGEAGRGPLDPPGSPPLESTWEDDPAGIEDVVRRIPVAQVNKILERAAIMKCSLEKLYRHLKNARGAESQELLRFEGRELTEREFFAIRGRYEVEAVVDFDATTGLYLVKWAGYPDSDNTWEPVKNLRDCWHFVERFAQATGKAVGPRPRPSSAPRMSAKAKAMAEGAAAGGAAAPRPRRPRRASSPRPAAGARQGGGVGLERALLLARLAPARPPRPRPPPLLAPAPYPAAMSAAAPAAAAASPRTGAGAHGLAPATRRVTLSIDLVVPPEVTDEELARTARRAYGKACVKVTKRRSPDAA